MTDMKHHAGAMFFFRIISPCHANVVCDEKFLLDYYDDYYINFLPYFPSISNPIPWTKNPFSHIRRRDNLFQIMPYLISNGKLRTRTILRSCQMRGRPQFWFRVSQQYIIWHDDIYLRHICELISHSTRIREEASHETGRWPLLGIYESTIWIQSYYFNIPVTLMIHRQWWIRILGLGKIANTIKIRYSQ